MAHMALFLALLDQFRYMAGVLVMVFLLCHRALVHQEQYARRIAVSSFLMLSAAFLYVPYSRLVAPVAGIWPIVTAPYWAAMNLLPVAVVRYCYETNLPGALLRTMLTSFTENIITVIVRYLIVLNAAPQLPEEHPALYILMMALLYTFFYWCICRTLVRSTRRDEHELYEKTSAATRIYLTVYLSYIAILGMTKIIFENLILPVGEVETLRGVFRFLRYFLMGDMILLSVVMTNVMWYIYDRMFIQNEKAILVQMAHERQSQYEFSRENIEMINRKSHDLKHQLRALEQMSDAERRDKISETLKAIDFYDAVVKTGNDALDTLLTEKSVYCTNHGIRLSCMVNTRRMEKLDLVDLYTLLGNAIDNAIESADRLSDEGKKTVSLSIRDQGKMLYIQVENFYEGEIKTADGLPVTIKADKENHGYGIKSIRTIARRYGGDIRIETADGIFSLQIILPT